MPPQIYLAKTALLGNAARGHINQAVGKGIIRWSCNPPPSVRKTLQSLAKLRGAASAAKLLQGSGKISARA